MLTENEHRRLANLTTRNHIHKLSNKQLAQLRRSSRTGSNLLARVVAEQQNRGLLKSVYRPPGGYPPEINKRISDYED
jgi:hypothetical protein